MITPIFPKFSSFCLGSGTKVLVPAYWGATTDSDGNCNESQFEALAAAGSKVAVIVNANSGPITPENGYYNTYHACAQLLKDANNEVFGYVSTKKAHLEGNTWVQTGLEDIDEVKQFVRDWNEFYDLSGIFLDEVSSAWQSEHKPEWGDHVKFYQEIFETVKETNPNFRIMLNVGGIPPPEFINASDHVTADVTITLEINADKYDPQSVDGGFDTCLDTLWHQEQGNFPPGPWCPFVPIYDHVEWMKDGFDNGTWPDKAAGVILYGSEDHAWVPWDAVAQAKQANFEYIYISERLDDTAYFHLPAYWDELVAAVNAA